MDLDRARQYAITGVVDAGFETETKSRQALRSAVVAHHQYGDSGPHINYRRALKHGLYFPILLFWPRYFSALTSALAVARASYALCHSGKHRYHSNIQISYLVLLQPARARVIPKRQGLDTSLVHRTLATLPISIM